MSYLADLVESEQLVAGGDVQPVTGLGLLQSLRAEESDVKNANLNAVIGL